MECVIFQGIPLKVYKNGGVISKIEIVKKCFKEKNIDLQKKLTSFWRGDNNSIKYFLDASEELKIIYRKAQEIPFGKVSSYGAISRAIFGDTRHSRFVGYAMHINPLPIIVPCHRVIKTDGEIGGFGSGVQNKIKLLKAEGVKVNNGRVTAIYFTDL